MYSTVHELWPYYCLSSLCAVHAMEAMIYRVFPLAYWLSSVTLPKPNDVRRASAGSSVSTFVTLESPVPRITLLLPSVYLVLPVAIFLNDQAVDLC